MSKFFCLVTLAAVGGMPLAQGCPFASTGCMTIVIEGVPAGVVGLAATVELTAIVYRGATGHTYEWLQVNGSGAQIDSPGQPVTTITLPEQPGTYRFVLIVTDGDGKRAASELVEIVVG